MAKKLDIPVVLVASINRESIKRLDGRPQLSDFRDSGKIEFDLQCAFLLYRASQYKQDADESEAELILAKNRQGYGNAIFEMEWEPEKAMFSRITKKERKTKHDDDWQHET